VTCNILQYAATCCSMRQHNAPRCDTRKWVQHEEYSLSDASQHTATHCNTRVTYFNTLQQSQHGIDLCNSLQHAATYCIALQYIATHCNTLQHITTHCNTLQQAQHEDNASLMHCNTLQHTATRCNTLQHAATRCNTLQQVQHEEYPFSYRPLGLPSRS